MQTRRLYYEDCHTHTFTAQVTGCQQSGAGFAVTLDATAFYPGGGGQACDLGTLGDASVLKVWEESGEPVHLCSSPLAPGSQVTGTIDYPARFSRMQQHTGEHIVSGLVYSRLGLHNVGFHMGSEVVTIDFDGEIPPDMLPELEEAANQAVWQDLPLRCWYPSALDLPHETYRSKRALPWPVRLVEIPGVDVCACCGVHVARTGEVGLVKLLSCVRFHQGVRIEMVCGKLAMDLLNRVYAQNRIVSQVFSSPIQDTGRAAQRAAEALEAEKVRGAGLQRRVFASIARDFAGAGDVLYFESSLDSATVQQLADTIAESCGGIAAVFSGDDHTFTYCVATRGSTDLRCLVRAMNQRLQGRGGGKPNFQQGRLNASRQEIQDFWEKRQVWASEL